MGVTAIIPVFNQANLLLRLLETLTTQTVPLDEIVVVDNASTDGAPDVARRFGCRIVSLETNTGFAHAVNVGWKAARSEWVAILNSDVELSPAWLEHLLTSAGNAGFATGTLLQAGNREAIDGTYDLLSRSGCAWRAGFGQPAQPQAMEPSPIAIAPGTACVFRRTILQQLEGFDETFGSYLEDVDLGLRCVRAGIAGVYVPQAIAFHRGSASLGRWNPRVVHLISRNQLRLVAKHYDRSLFSACFWHIVTGQLLWGLVAARHGAALAWFRGKLEGLCEFRLEGQPSPRLREFLLASEQEIRQRAKDSYWRWYFRLTPGAAH